MTLSCGMLCWFAEFACQKWWTVLFQSIDHCSLHWLCCWARCWMFQDMDRMEASCVFYVKVGMLNHLEHSQIWLVTINKVGTVSLTVQYDLIVIVSFMHYPGDILRQTSADILSLEENAIYIWQSCDFGCRTLQFILEKSNKIRLTDCQSRDGGKPLQHAAIHSMIQLEYNIQLGCYWCDSDMKLGIYSSGLPTSFRYHLPLLFHTTKSWIHKHLNQGRPDQNRAERLAFSPICPTIAHSKHPDSS